MRRYNSALMFTEECFLLYTILTYLKRLKRLGVDYEGCSSVDTVNNLRNKRLTNRCWIPDMGKRVFSSVFKMSLGFTEPPLQWVTRPGVEFTTDS